MAEPKPKGDRPREPIPPIGTQMSRLAAEEPDRPAVTHHGRTLTRGELESTTNRLARAYAELGVRQGDYVTIALPNSIEWVQAVVECLDALLLQSIALFELVLASLTLLCS